MLEYNFDSGENFCGENLCGKFFPREFFFADREKKTPQKSQKSQKLEPAKIQCHTVYYNKPRFSRQKAKHA